MIVDLQIKYNITEKISQHEADFSNLLTSPIRFEELSKHNFEKNQDLKESEQKNGYSDFFSGLEIV